MNRRQRWIVQGVLAIVAGLLAWRLGTEWQQSDLRYRALASPAEPRAAELPVTLREEPLVADEIAAKNLFSADRNNEIPPPESKEAAGPPPPAPTVVGTMKLGENYEALMSEGESSRGGVRRVKQGDQIGAYRVTEIQDEKVVVEYQGQTTTLAIYQSARSVAQQRTRTPMPAGPAAPVVVGTGRVRPATPSRTPAVAQPPTPPPGGRQVQDPNVPPGTRVFIEGNRRRLERDTPFGVHRYYEPLKPGDTEQGTGNRE